MKKMLVVLVLLFIFKFLEANDKFLYVFYRLEECDLNIRSSKKLLFNIKKEVSSSGGFYYINLQENPIESIQFDLIKREDGGSSEVGIYLSSGTIGVPEIAKLNEDSLIYYFDQEYTMENWKFNKWEGNFLNFSIDKKDEEGLLKESINYRINFDDEVRESVKKIGGHYEETVVYKKDKLVESRSKKDGLVIYEVKKGDGIYCISNDGKRPSALCDYKNGLKNGEYKIFRDYLGKIFSFPLEVITYKNNKRSGPYLLYNEKGVLVIKGSYLDSKPVGVWQEFVFDEDGVLLETINTTKD